MKLVNNFILDFENLEVNKVYFDLLKEEDFIFKTKDIFVNINFRENKIFLEIVAGSILDLKIGNSAVIKSLEIIDKTLEI